MSCEEIQAKSECCRLQELQARQELFGFLCLHPASTIPGTLRTNPPPGIFRAKKISEQGKTRALELSAFPARPGAIDAWLAAI